MRALPSEFSSPPNIIYTFLQPSLSLIGRFPSKSTPVVPRRHLATLRHPRAMHERISLLGAALIFLSGDNSAAVELHTPLSRRLSECRWDNNRHKMVCEKKVAKKSPASTKALSSDTSAAPASISTDCAKYRAQSSSHRPKVVVNRSMLSFQYSNKSDSCPRISPTHTSMPIIEFGDSDSGTREIRNMFIAFGVTMPQDMDNGSGDLLKLFAVGDPKAFPHVWSTREMGDVNCLPMLRSILKNRHNLDYDAKDLPSGILAPTLKLLKCAASSIAAHVATKSEGTGLWGWKNPRQIVLAPVWAQLFGGPACTLMVQTVRDGRDSAWAHNPVQFNHYAGGPTTLYSLLAFIF